MASNRCVRLPVSNLAAMRSPSRQRSSISAIYGVFNAGLEHHELTKALFEAVSVRLADKGALRRGGTMALKQTEQRLF